MESELSTKDLMLISQESLREDWEKEGDQWGLYSEIADKN